MLSKVKNRLGNYKKAMTIKKCPVYDIDRKTNRAKNKRLS